MAKVHTFFCALILINAPISATDLITLSSQNAHFRKGLEVDLYGGSKVQFSLIDCEDSSISHKALFKIDWILADNTCPRILFNLRELAGNDAIARGSVTDYRCDTPITDIIEVPEKAYYAFVIMNITNIDTEGYDGDLNQYKISVETDASGMNANVRPTFVRVFIFAIFYGLVALSWTILLMIQRRHIRGMHLFMAAAVIIITVNKCVTAINLAFNTDALTRFPKNRASIRVITMLNAFAYTLAYIPMIMICHGVGIKEINKDYIEDSHPQRTVGISWLRIWWRNFVLCFLGALSIITYICQTYLPSHNLHIHLGYYHREVNLTLRAAFDFIFYVACYLVLRRTINCMKGLMCKEYKRYILFRWIFRAFLLYRIIYNIIIFAFRIQARYDTDNCGNGSTGSVVSWIVEMILITFFCLFYYAMRPITK